VTTSNRRLLSLAALLVALGLLVLGAVYQADAPKGVAFTGTPTGPTTPGDVAAPATDPIEGWFPQGGPGSACREKVGVDLAPGFRASLTINGIPIPDDELNEVKDPGSAGATLNQVTWGPEEDCPRGAILRPTTNEVQACVRRTEEPPQECVVRRFEFEAL
jgi:hypothetical protein